MNDFHTLDFIGLALILTTSIVWLASILWSSRGMFRKLDTVWEAIGFAAALTFFERVGWVFLTVDYEADYAGRFLDTFGKEAPSFGLVLPAGATLAFIFFAVRHFRSSAEEKENFVHPPLNSALYVLAGAILGLALAEVSAFALRLLAVGLLIAAIAAVVAGVLWGLYRAHQTGSLAGILPKKQISRGANSHYNSDGTAKVEFKTVAEAQELADRLHAKDGANMTVYRCSQGRHYHVGRSNR